jgi:hypothetical protein
MMEESGAEIDLLESMGQRCPMCQKVWHITFYPNIYKHYEPSGKFLICNIRTGQKRKELESRNHV